MHLINCKVCLIGRFLLCSQKNLDKSRGVSLAVYMVIVKADNPGFMFIQSKEQIVEFQIKFRELLNEIREVHGEQVIIKLIIAAPNLTRPFFYMIKLIITCIIKRLCV